MRSLTIKREESFAGKLSKCLVFIESTKRDAELIIGGYNCKYLGSIKNGEEATFQITNDKCRIFVIANKVTKDLCNDFCVIPEGRDDIMLSGKNHFNPLNLNAFIFNGRPSRDMIKNRKNNKKFGAILLSAIVFIGFLIGIVASCGVKKQKFTYDNMTITLTNEFSKSEVNGWEFCYSSDDVTVFGKKESTEDYPILETLTLAEYSSRMLSNINLKDSVRLRAVNDYYYFTYEMQNVGGKMDLTYYVITFKADDGFWVMNFSVPSEKVSDHASDIFKFADSVQFK